MAIVTLLTDFGLVDTYVGQVKGAILSVAPSATLVDLTHAVPPQDVFAGAFLLWSAVEAFTMIATGVSGNHPRSTSVAANAADRATPINTTSVMPFGCAFPIAEANPASS